MPIERRRPIAGPLPWLAVALVVLAPAAGAQEPPAEAPLTEQLKSLAEPESAKSKTATDDKEKPPFEFFRSQIAPFDATPYAKPHHWNTLVLDMKANQAAYEGSLQSSPVTLFGMPQAVVYRREARLAKGQETRLAFQVMLPPFADAGGGLMRFPKELNLDLVRPESVRPDASWPATLMRLGTHQMLVTVLARQPAGYAPWRRLRAVSPPPPTDGGGSTSNEDRLYYRLVLPLDPAKPLLSPHPLTWTSISHVVWDGLDPDAINTGQQRALVDWLHWGGQLVVVGGAGINLAALQESFLGPYLPADPTGESIPLAQADLQPLAEAHPPPAGENPLDVDPDEGADPNQAPAASASMSGTLAPPMPPPQAVVATTKNPAPPIPQLTYGAPVPIRPAANRPVALTGLRPREGATPLPLGPGSPHLLGAEWRVGRGRVTLLGVNPTEKVFSDWPGIDTFVRRIVLRRPEEGVMHKRGDPAVRPLGGPELSWLRYAARDLEAQTPQASEEDGGLPSEPVAAWLDSAWVPTACRAALENASGISIPSRAFVLRVLLMYGIALVPLNWLICRYVLGRREWAWIVVPVLALGTAVAVERAAANEQGFESASDEIDLLELQGNYSRAHLSRFVALYSTGRTRYAIAYPGDPDSLALPLNTEGGLKGDELVQSAWSSFPVPTLEGFSVQPRSLAMFRAEQMVDLRGRITLKATPGAPAQVVNQTDLELRDVMLVGPGAEPIRLGTIPPGASVALDKTITPEPGKAADARWTDAASFLEKFREYRWDRPEDRGERRLVAWVAGARPRQEITPAVDRTRGLTLVVAHLGYGPPPGPLEPPYAPTAKPERPPEANRP